MDKKENLQELFALPWGLQEVANLDGFSLYSSDSLKRKYKKAMRKQKFTRDVSNNINELVDNNKIIPCFINKNIFKISLFKIFVSARSESKMVLGFYYPEINKIFLIIDNLTTLGYTSDKFLAKLTLHEGMHMLADKIKLPFIKTFDKELTSYYDYLFRTLFKIRNSNNSEKSTKKIIEFIFKNFEMKIEPTKSNLKKYENLLRTEYFKISKYEKLDFENKLEDYMLFVGAYVEDFNIFIKLLSIRKFQNIFFIMYDAYKKGLRFKNDETLVIQELLYPSEVIAVMSENKKTSSVINGFKKL